jgi:two-component system, LytTR family, sensor kinase
MRRDGRGVRRAGPQAGRTGCSVVAPCAAWPYAPRVTTLIHDASSRPGPSPRQGRALRPALIVVAAWTAVGLLSASQYYLAARSLGRPGNWGLQLLRELPPWQVWSLLTPFAFALARRFPLVPGRLARGLPVHVAAGVACAMIYLAAYALWMYYVMPSYDMAMPDLFMATFRARFNVALILYAGLIGVHHAIWSFGQLREREIETARIQADSARARADAADARAGLARARLQVLRSQLHPHFLFNTLHSIASLMDEDVPTARRLIARLSDLLRTTLEVGEAKEVRLADELEFLERYLDIERVRYGTRLRVTWDIAPETLPALLPPLLLQPLVENSIRHGIGPIEEGGTITIHAARIRDRLCIEIADTGPGFQNAGTPGTGSGLRITRERLQYTYGPDHLLATEAAGRPRAAVRIQIPFRVDGHTAAGSPAETVP